MRIARLIEIAKLDYGFAFDSQQFNSEARGLPLVRIRDVVSGTSETYYAGKYSDRYLVEDGDYLIGMDGQFNLARWRGGKALLNQRVCRIGELDDSVDRAYLAQFMPTALKAIEDATPFVTVKHLSAKALNAIEVPLPHPTEQRRIAAILDHADALRAKRHQVLDQLHALTRSIYFSTFEDKPWDRVNLVSLARTPDDIKCGPFGTQLQASEFRSEGIPLLGIKNVNARFDLPPFEFLEEETARRLHSYDLREGDIVMTRKGTIGNCAIYPQSARPGIMHSDLLRLRVDQDATDVSFLEHHLQLSPRVSRQIAMMSPGAVMPGINVTKLKQLEVDRPPLSLQRKFAMQIDHISRHRTAVRAALAADGELSAALQSRAFRGDL